MSGDIKFYDISRWGNYSMYLGNNCDLKERGKIYFDQMFCIITYILTVALSCNVEQSHQIQIRPYVKI